MENGYEVLGELLDKFWLGLAKPLHFFPESSSIYLQALVLKNKSAEEALRSARNTWLGSDFKPGEGRDPYYQLCFDRTNPLDEQFQDLASGVLGPLFGHLREIGT